MNKSGRRCKNKAEQGKIRKYLLLNTKHLKLILASEKITVWKIIFDFKDIIKFRALKRI